MGRGNTTQNENLNPVVYPDGESAFENQITSGGRRLEPRINFRAMSLTSGVITRHELMSDAGV